MWARVTRFRIIPQDRIDEDIRDTKEVIREAATKIAGFSGVYYLLDRERGETMAVTLWQDEQAMRASEDQTARMRAQSAESLGAEILSVERYEVTLQPSDIMSTAR